MVRQKTVFGGNRGLLTTSNQIRYGYLKGEILRCVKIG